LSPAVARRMKRGRSLINSGGSRVVVERNGALNHRRFGMTDLPQALREQLAADFECRPLKLQAQAVSRDGSIKYAWHVPAGAPVEAVLMPGFDYGTALCVSSQSGCALGCGFCQTGVPCEFEIPRANLIA